MTRTNKARSSSSRLSSSLRAKSGSHYHKTTRPLRILCYCEYALLVSMRAISFNVRLRLLNDCIVKPRWFKYLIVWLCLALLAVPVYFIDQALFAPRGGNWISLDFRGLLFGPYVDLVAIYVALSAITLLFARPKHMVLHQLGLILLSIVLVVAGLLTYGKMRDAAARHQREAFTESRRPLRDLIELNSWSYFPDDVSPAEIRVNVTVHNSGRFAGNVTGMQTDAQGSFSTVFQSANTPDDQRQVTKGETFTYVFPLQILHKAPADDVEITLELFQAPSGPASGDVEKIFMKSPRTEDDGQFFYGALPPPSQPVKL
ncbi:MAG: hypothetical protein ACJ8KU_07965 [Chthoniobacterales bacterium]